MRRKLPMLIGIFSVVEFIRDRKCLKCHKLEIILESRRRKELMWQLRVMLSKADRRFVPYNWGNSWNWEIFSYYWNGGWSRQKFLLNLHFTRIRRGLILNATRLDMSVYVEPSCSEVEKPLGLFARVSWTKDIETRRDATALESNWKRYSSGEGFWVVSCTRQNILRVATIKWSFFNNNWFGSIEWEWSFTNVFYNRCWVSRFIWIFN